MQVVPHLPGCVGTWPAKCLLLVLILRLTPFSRDIMHTPALVSSGLLAVTYIFCDPYLLNTAADVTITRTNGTPDK